MRQVVLDTETTGLDPQQGHRIIEVGCVEMKNRRRTRRVFHQYVNPERDIEEGAFEVHGISREDLAGKPLFADIARDFIEFVRGSELIIHNAPFDVEFINAELQRLGETWGRIEDVCTVTDSLALARELHPGQRNSLDALCQRYDVDNSGREWHGALLDAQILMDVYLAMTGGQAALLLEDDGGRPAAGQGGVHQRVTERQGPLRTIRPTPAELEAHARRLERIDGESGGRCIWLHDAGEEGTAPV